MPNHWRRWSQIQLEKTNEKACSSTGAYHSKENGFKLGKIAPGLWVSPSALLFAPDTFYLSWHLFPCPVFWPKQTPIETQLNQTVRNHSTWKPKTKSDPSEAFPYGRDLNPNQSSVSFFGCLNRRLSFLTLRPTLKEPLYRLRRPETSEMIPTINMSITPSLNHQGSS